MSSAPSSIQASTPRPACADSRVLALVGSGGDGVAVLGDIILQMAAQQGLYGVMVQSYGPQIRGGESAVVLRLSREEVQYEGDEADLLLCFRAADLKRFLGAVRLHAGSVMVLETADEGALPEWLGRDGRDAFRYAFARMDAGAEVPGEPKNMKALALIVKLLGWSPELARETLGRRFGHRAARLTENLTAFDQALAHEGMPVMPALTGHGRVLHVETGNEALARGAMDAGLGFFAGYPITPSSEVMETLIEEFPDRGGRVVQAEDEIAALGMVLGASFGGVTSMTATSGPGLSLMTEMLGLASMAELPAVIIDCQRAGPATGMPSRTEQSDLYHAVYGGHGDFPRAVLGVFDVLHGREVMHKALHLSEAYQMPVLVLSDAYIAQRRQILEPPGDLGPHPARKRWTPDDGPARFDLSGEKGVNAFRVPGTPGGTYPAAGIEHTPDGLPTADTNMHQRMNTKRFAKLAALAVETAGWVRTFGDPGAPNGIVSWGSQFGLLREWVKVHPGWRVFLPEIIHPFPTAAFEKWRQGLERIAVVELSFQGQFHHHLAGHTDIRGIERLGRSGGVPITLRELEHLLEARS